MKSERIAADSESRAARNVKRFKPFKWFKLVAVTLVTICSLLTALSGCATQASMVDVESELEKILQKQAELEKRLAFIEENRSTGAPQGQTDLVIKMDQLATDLQTLQGKMEENTHLLTEISQRSDDQAFRIQELSERLDVLDGQVVALEKSVGQITGAPVSPGRRIEPEPPSKEPSKEPPVVLPGRPTQKDKTTGLSPSEAYGLAYNDYLKGNYDLALMGFQNFLAQFKTTSLAPNAQYWIGESYYGKKDYVKAIEAFEKVVADYPGSNKVPGALLKTGYAYVELGNKQKARTYLKKVIEDHPFSNEANLAKNRLAELK
jgi:tol-pal system protein YbgF